jgi:polar amino acid transport system substrate-binding protein
LTLRRENHLVRRLVALSAVLVVLLAACGGGGDDVSVDTDEAADDGGFQPMIAGTLTVGTELPAPPFWIGDGYDSITEGYEVDLAREIAERLGLDGVTFVEMPFAGLVAGQECPCDVDFGQVTITEERAAVVDFTAPYFDANQGVMVNAGTEVPDVATAQGLRWGVQVNTTGATYLAEEIAPQAEPQVYSTVVDLFAALRAGQVDAVMMDTPIVLGEAARSGSGFEVVGQFETGEQYGGVLAKDSPNTPIISGVIEDLREEGFLDELGERYFNDPAAVPVIDG